MSYLVLARKSRPQTFAEIVGQKPVVRTLQNALAQNRVPHAMIFSGIRGTGKTTLARIMAKALNCEHGPATEPCNQCRSCREIAEGISIDLQEIDGASNRGIQEIRELKEQIRFMPTSSRFKIVLIDEVHMLTTEAFNALLKTLEEPPEHVYFMFATTELHKIPLTILSRCQRYELKRLSHKELAEHFHHLAEQEGVNMDPQAVDMIAREAAGSVRDGLSLLDQIFSYCGNKVQASDVIEMLGLVNQQLVAQLGRALIDGDLATIYTLLNQIYLYGTDIRRLGNELLQWFRNLVICSIEKNPASMLEVSDEELKLLSETAATTSLDTITTLFNLLLEGMEKVNYSSQPRLALELTFIRAVQYRDVVPISGLIACFDKLLAGMPLTDLPIAPQPGQKKTPPLAAPSSTTPRQEVTPPVQADTRPPVTKDIPQTAAPEGEPEPQSTQTAPISVHPQEESGNTQQHPPAEPIVETVEPVTHPVAATPEQPAQTVPQPIPGSKRIRQQWEAFIQYVRERQPWTAAALQLAKTVEPKGSELIIHFVDSADCSLLRQPANVKRLNEYFLDFFQENLTIQFAVPGNTTCSVDPANGQATQQERRSLANDPLVLTAIDVFTGQVGDIRTGPRYRTRKEEKPNEDDAPAIEED